MATSERQPHERTNTRNDPERVQLIAAEADKAERVLSELDSVTEERFHVPWVTEFPGGTERLGDGGMGTALVDLNLPGSQGTETLDKVVNAAPDVPVLNLSESDTEATARQTVQHGGDDYVVKEQPNGYRLRGTVRTMMDHRAEGEVALENEMANATLNSIGAGVLRTDLHGNVTYLNRFAEKITGWLREEALGRPVEDVLRLVNSTSGVAIDDAVVTVLQGDRTGSAMICAIDCTLLRRDGVELEVENRVTSSMTRREMHLVS